MKRLRHIHTVNHLWHLSMEAEEAAAIRFFGARKGALQNRLLADPDMGCYLERDVETSNATSKDLFVIRVPFEGKIHDACHIPSARVDPEILEWLQREGRVR